MDQIIERFSNFSDWEEKYSYIIKMGRELKAPTNMDDKFLIKGCQSRVWLIPRYDQGILTFSGDSDALISKGLLALVLTIFSGKTPAEILDMQETFLAELGILDHISASRTNGVLSMIKQIKMYALVYLST